MVGLLTGRQWRRERDLDREHAAHNHVAWPDLEAEWRRDMQAGRDEHHERSAVGSERRTDEQAA